MCIYEGHMGWLYSSDELLDYEDLYCETCGDSDTLDIDGSGGWDYEYVKDFIEANFEKDLDE